MIRQLPLARESEGVAVAGAAAPGADALYLHIPFCERRCEYCDFTAIGGKRGSHAYMQALIAEVGMLGNAGPARALRTIFIGGGTPSFVDPEEIEALLEAVNESFGIAADCEITMEANPSSTTAARALIWRSAGVNRLSMGIQSFDDAVLTALGRVHSADRARDAYADARTAGFASVSGDFIQAVPGVSHDGWASTLEEAVRLGFDHVSSYELILEPSTALYGRWLRGEFAEASDEACNEAAAIADSVLGSAGYRQYEVSNYAKAGHECRHNLVYWHGGHYHAAGVGAHGFLERQAVPFAISAPDGASGFRFWHVEGVGAYVERIGEGKIPLAGGEWIDEPTHAVEKLMLGLRLNEGIPASWVREERLEPLTRHGLMVPEGALIRATPHGRRVLNAVIAELAGDGDETLNGDRLFPRVVKL